MNKAIVNHSLQWSGKRSPFSNISSKYVHRSPNEFVEKRE